MGRIPYYPERRPVYSEGSYTAHYGKLSYEDSRWFWIEGPTLTGRMAPVASCWNEGDAIRAVKEYAKKERKV